MKYILYVFLFFSIKIEAQTATTPIMYLPDGEWLSIPTNARYIPGTIQDWYQNLEKYWYYRYELVNDYLFINDQDSAGSSIPAQGRRFSNNIDGDGTNRLKWADATIDLGHYIQMLAIEDQLLYQYNYSSMRTHYELQHALNALDRLDYHARAYENCIKNNLGAYNGYPGTAVYPLVSLGYFPRDDVPWLTILDPTYPGNQYNHFNRPGLAGSWPYSTGGRPGMDIVNNADANFSRTWYGTLPGHGSYPSWTYPEPKYPGQESVDQLVDINLGMTLVTHYCTDAGLKSQAASALFRTVKYPHDCSFWPQIRNSIDRSCVYGTSPTNNCEDGGANFFFQAYGGATESHLYADPYGHSSLGMIAQDIAGSGLLSGPVAFWNLSAFDGFLINCRHSNRNFLFTDYYAATTNGWWPITWAKIKDHADRDIWGRPQLPLIYEIIFNPRENYRYIDYERVLTAAPDCGPNNFSVYYDGTSYPWVDAVTANPDILNWSGNDWISEPLHRWMTCYGATTNNHASTSNGLDYMVLFDLFALKQGMGSYLQGMINPYYADDYQVNYPDNNGFGSSTNPIQLNFLEYANITGNYNYNCACSLRCGQQLDFWQGFNAIPNTINSYADGSVKDYRCDEDMPFTFAKVYCPSCPVPPVHHFVSDGKMIDTIDSNTPAPIASMPIMYFPGGIHYTPNNIPPPENAPPDGGVELTPEREKYMFDSMVNLIIAAGNEDMINYLRQMGVNVDSFIQGQDNSQLFPLIVNLYPNPTNGAAYLEYTLIKDSKVVIQFTNALGQDLNSYIEPYKQEQPPGNYKITLNSDMLPSGFYIVSIKIDNHTFSKKLSVL